MNVVQTILPHAEHRHCVDTFLPNGTSHSKGMKTNYCFGRQPRHNMADYNEALHEMENLKHDATARFRRANPKVFCRAFLKIETKADVIVNNLVETFKGYIINARTKHLIYMLEDIRTTLMQRLVMKRQEMEMTTYVLCPRIQTKLDKEKEEAANRFPMPSNNLIFQVNHKMDYLIVDTGGKTCTCWKWDMSDYLVAMQFLVFFFILYEC